MPRGLTHSDSNLLLSAMPTINAKPLITCRRNCAIRPRGVATSNKRSCWRHLHRSTCCLTPLIPAYPAHWQRGAVAASAVWCTVHDVHVPATHTRRSDVRKAPTHSDPSRRCLTTGAWLRVQYGPYATHNEKRKVASCKSPTQQRRHRELPRAPIDTS